MNPIVLLLYAFCVAFCLWWLSLWLLCVCLGPLQNTSLHNTGCFPASQPYLSYILWVSYGSNIFVHFYIILQCFSCILLLLLLILQFAIVTNLYEWNVIILHYLRTLSNGGTRVQRKLPAFGVVSSCLNVCAVLCVFGGSVPLPFHLLSAGSVSSGRFPSSVRPSYRLHIFAACLFLVLYAYSLSACLLPT